VLSGGLYRCFVVLLLMARRCGRFLAGLHASRKGAGRQALYAHQQDGDGNNRNPAHSISILAPKLQSSRGRDP
jgi:hypothetical protein